MQFGDFILRLGYFKVGIFFRYFFQKFIVVMNFPLYDTTSELNISL